MDWDSENTWEMVAEVLRETAQKVLGLSTGSKKEGKKTWWWNKEVQEAILQKKEARKKWYKGNDVGVSSSIWKQRKRLRGQ